MFVSRRVQSIAGCDASQPEAQTAVVPNRRSIACHFLSRPTFGRKQIFGPLAQEVDFEPHCCAQSNSIPVIAVQKDNCQLEITRSSVVNA
jgi:hypothetical protein